MGANIIGLKDWDTSGNLSATDPGVMGNLKSALTGIASFLSTQQKTQQDQQFRDAIKKEMGIDVPQGVDAAKLYETIMTEKAKEQITPSGWKPQNQQEAFDFEKAKRPNWLTSAAPDTNTPVIPEGMEVTGYDQRGVPMLRKIKPNIPEQKFNIEQADKVKKQEERSQYVKAAADDALSTISEVEKDMSNFGLLGGLPSIPGTARVNWEANVNKLLSGKVIDVMTKMKEASKTGATGFGQLSEKELKVLQEASTALKRGLSPEDAQRYLDAMKVMLQKVSQPGGNEMPTPGMANKVGKYTLVQ
jgi:hypothetical protein